MYGFSHLLHGCLLQALSLWLLQKSSMCIQGYKLCSLFAGAAIALSCKLVLAQQGPATCQEPLSTGTSHGITIQDTSMGSAHKQTGHTATNGQGTPDQQSKDSSSGASNGAKTDSRNVSGDSSERMQAPRDPHFTAVHPPDMQQAIAWQLAYRGLMQQQVREASQAAKHDTGATETRDMHVTIQVL
jgi:hypothetical protein